MTMKKTLLALGTAGVVAIAGAGVAAAETPETADTTTPPTQGSADASADRDVFGSVTGADALGSWTDGQFDYSKATDALVSLAVGGAAITTIAGAYNAVVGASDTFQGVVSDTQAFLESQGIL
ncbi:MAG TPA: hypothetical protein DIW82_03645 [Corynebacterium nuruki]|jgi:hypothetical protein|uniref:Secreted protein n=1 Tax=Corynebacterium nuruki TaxID=1032851 RepID=A0A3D4SXA6_9CORY|nr:hypothetical protein [Corynebacterium nuruki]